MISEELITAARKKGRLIDHTEEIAYSCFREKFKSVLRGTVLLGNRIIPGYQRIGRVFTLQKGLEKNISTDFVWLEEKIDGYNLRIAKINGKIFAFSRSGFLDLFSTEKVREMRLETFFDDNPDLVLCGEMIGNTPYTPPVKGYDVKLLVFDVMDDQGEYVPQEKKYSFLKKYGIASVPILGKFAKKDLAKIKKVVLEVNKKNKEGIVIKSEDRKQIIKYVVPNSDIADIDSLAHAIFDTPAGFYHQRILRSAIGIMDFGMNRKKYSAELGDAFYKRLMDGISNINKQGEVYDEFEILIKNPETWDLLLKHMSHDIKLEVVERKQEKNGMRIRFRKVYKETTRRLKEIMSGKTFED